MDTVTSRDLPTMLALVAGLAVVGAVILWRPPAVRRFLDRHRVPATAIVAAYWLISALVHLGDRQPWRTALDAAAAVAVAIWAWRQRSPP